MSRSIPSLVVVLGLSLFNGCVQSPELAIEPEPAWEPKTPIEADCAGMCEETIANDCEMSPSVKRCALRCAESVELTGPCRDTTQAYVRCLGEAGLESCFDVPAPCDDAWLAWSMCSATGNGCGPVQCGPPVRSGAPEEGCACRAFCFDSIVEEACVEGKGGWDCTCSVGGEVVAACGGQVTSCAFFVGCCADVVQAMQ